MNDIVHRLPYFCRPNQTFWQNSGIDEYLHQSRMLQSDENEETKAEMKQEGLDQAEGDGKSPGD